MKRIKKGHPTSQQSQLVIENPPGHATYLHNTMERRLLRESSKPTNYQTSGTTTITNAQITRRRRT